MARKRVVSRKYKRVILKLSVVDTNTREVSEKEATIYSGCTQEITRSFVSHNAPIAQNELLVNYDIVSTSNVMLYMNEQDYIAQAKVREVE